jgi:serine/threonine protein phosphatase 1
MMLFRRAAKAPALEENWAYAPEGVRLYAIGDVHGRNDLLARLADHIELDLAHRPVGRAITVFLGDYVDRGPDSAGVIDRLARGDFPTEIIALRGNHEATMLAFLRDPKALDGWRHYGAVETLASYGVDVRETLRGRGFEDARAALWAALPDHHLDFLQNTLPSWTAGDYFFVHAGVKPNVPLERQEERDLYWIRDEFLRHRGFFDHKRIVHGHTPTPAAELLANRINVDTGAYASGVLTCVALEGLDQRLITS